VVQAERDGAEPDARDKQRQKGHPRTKPHQTKLRVCNQSFSHIREATVTHTQNHPPTHTCTVALTASLRQTNEDAD